MGIFAEGDTVEELKENIKGGIDCYSNGSLENLKTPAIKPPSYNNEFNESES